MDTHIKICGLTRPEDARAAADAGAVYGGVILAPNSPRTVPPAAVADIFAGTGLLRCGVFVNETIDRVVVLAAQLELEVIQLHGEETADTVSKIRAASNAKVWKAVRPLTGEQFSEAADVFSAVVDGLLLDGWSASARGGTGTPFPWLEVARHRHRLVPGVRLIVAGGLTSGNVADAIATLAPEVVDVSSGVERSPGIKDPGLIRSFADAVRGARPTGEFTDGSSVRT